MKIKSSEQGKLKVPKLIKEIPEELKDPKCFDTIEKKIALIMKSDHTHKKVSAFAKCKWCSAKRQKRNDYIKELGFGNYQHYLQWRKIMQIIKDKKDFQL